MSDILIKGMKMPEKCGLCDLFHAESPMHCTVVKGHKTVGAPYGMPRPEWCPLVDLGKHGDLIDRDALRAKFPEPKDMIDPQQALVHITGVWAEIDCADVVIEAEDG